ncbi:ABC transporter ATP-binding protein [Phytoactinopolyspora halotolerans]|uniref:ABC transporter ATP-binding protein n=1 Tax=Phytoactinopolyspora halotolerans TaxID=1981512 RepID=UPI001C2055C7|nr:ABC transporter ATP-binding protein [Phytoactinopolyspora halotolerans]
MSEASTGTSASSRLGENQAAGALRTIRRGLALSPEIKDGLALTLVIALVATAGRVIVPIAVQQTVDRGLNAPGGADLAYVRWMCLVAGIGILVTVAAAYHMNRRLFRATEAGLATLRIKGFRHVHDLSVLTQNTERRGALVARVTTDVDTISQFLQFGGIFLLVNIGQLMIATVIMSIYSWQLTLLVWATFLPFFIALRWFQRWLSRAFMAVRQRVGVMLGAISESVVGAQAVRAYAIEARTQQRIDDAVEQHRRAAVRAQRLAAATFSTGEVVAGLANAAVVVVGVYLGIAGDVTLGQLLAFIFLVTLFVAPVQVGTEVLSEAQNAIAGWRRVLEVLDTPADVADPGDAGVVLPQGPVDVRFENVSYAYPDGPVVLDEVNVDIPARTRVAVVGETGSGKTTFAKLLTRLMDPKTGRVLLDGVDLREVRFDSLRRRMVMVPQEGFLFDDTLAANLRFGRPEATDDDIRRALDELGLSDWVESLPDGLDSPVGQRGESLSAGERQLVALARAYLADPDLLVLDEATSAVDPATEVRLARALEGVSRGRTSVTIAHRLSTAEAADEVFVFDSGRLVERGPHAKLVDAGGVYSKLHAAWITQSR